MRMKLRLVKHKKLYDPESIFFFMQDMEEDLMQREKGIGDREEIRLVYEKIKD